MTGVEAGETKREREVQSGESLVVSGRAAGGSQSEVGATAAVVKGPVVCLTHLSHPFSGLTALPRGSVGSCSLRVQWCSAGLPVALQQSAFSLLTVAGSPGKSAHCWLPVY